MRHRLRLLLLPLFLTWPVVAGQTPEDMVFIEAGPCIVGHGERPPYGPRHTVSLPAFRIDRTEVTVAAYRRCVAAGACRWNAAADSPRFFTDDQPMVLVDWFEARDYCRWVGKRLPSEIEWEKAARGTEGFLYPWGNDYRPNLANLADVSQAPLDLSFFRFTWPVGRATGDISPAGVRDMAGNVAEWTADRYRFDYHALVLTVAYQPPTAEDLITVRGGSFISEPEKALLYRRDGQRRAASRGLRLGFRCAQDADE